MCPFYYVRFNTSDTEMYFHLPLVFFVDVNQYRTTLRVEKEHM